MVLKKMRNFAEEIECMPMISVFLGLIIRMFYKEHNPPHIHVAYQGNEAIVNILDGTVMGGKLSDRNNRLIQAWIELHRDELIANWELCRDGIEPIRIPPLQ
ncbi:hypothetical protein FACS1894201_10930 [Bacteroidia bacterium]|nr:hypothetical protein FACS1894201_10930 [Bacteroidia bacterium]